MTSFKKKIEELEKSHAYCLGAEACMSGKRLDNSPFDRGSIADEEWVDGYLDVMFLRRITGESRS